MNVPKMWTKREWRENGNIRVFRNHHGTQEPTYSKTFGITPEQWYKAGTDKEMYQIYTDWWLKTYTKLGRVLS